MEGGLGNTLSWGDQEIPEPIDEVVDIHDNSYDRKRKAMMKKIVRKMNLTLENTLFIITKETLFDTKNTRMIELIIVGMAIIDATLDKEKRDEREVASMRKELEHL